MDVVKIGRTAKTRKALSYFFVNIIFKVNEKIGCRETTIFLYSTLKPLNLNT